MKLAKITTLDDPYYLQLRWILDSQKPVVVENTVLQLKKVGRNFKEPRLIPYIFIESVVKSNVLSEGALGELLKTGIAKLKAALTPGPGGDVETLLTFMAPKGGGMSAVNGLIKQASSSQGSLLDDEQWWEQIFGAFNMGMEAGDQAAKVEIQQQVQQDILSGGAEDEAAAPAPVAGADTIDGSREKLEQEMGSLFNRLEQARGDKTEPAAPEPAAPEPAAPETLGDVSDVGLEPEPDEKNRLILPGDDNFRMPQRESTDIAYDLALSLLNESSVRSNIGLICNIMLQRIGADHNVKMPMVSEAGLLQRLKDSVGGIPGKLKGGMDTARNMVANPNYASKTLAASGESSTNERAAKLAVQILSDKKRAEFESILSANGLTPDQIVTTLGQWKDLKPKAEAGDPGAVQTYNQASETLKNAFELFNHGDAENDFDQTETPEEKPGEGPDPLAVDPDTDPTQIQAAEPAAAKPIHLQSTHPEADQLKRLKPAIDKLPEYLTTDESASVWKAITGKSPSQQKLEAVIAKMGGSMPKLKLVKAAVKSLQKAQVLKQSDFM